MTLAFRAGPKFEFSRDGLSKTVFLYSASGALLIDGALCELEADFKGNRLLIDPPKRLGHPSRRANPQIDAENLDRFLAGEAIKELPLQISAFPAKHSGDSAAFTHWLGPASEIADEHVPPPDTLVLTLSGQASSLEAEQLERHVIRPLFEWLRALSDQWWAGRTMESTQGGIHLAFPLDANDQLVGKPVPVCRAVSAHRRMRPINLSIWKQAAELMANGQRPHPMKSLQLDAMQAFASGELRSGIILACCAIEAGRDRILAEAGIKLRDLRCSSTDLLQHLSKGFQLKFGVNLADDAPREYAQLKAFWAARGDAAHGREIVWRTQDGVRDIEDVELAELIGGLADLLRWLALRGPEERATF